MSKVAQLKKKAAEFELKKQFDKALALYLEVLDIYERNPEETDVSLYNRVGDLMLRQGNVADAIDRYERAVDLYAEGGFFNNAIALCNKILRQSPGRAVVYYKLGKISAQKGFKSDAKRNFLEYADRMQKAGKLDEAFRALKEFADLCPDQDDIRLMLADQLSREQRTDEAIEQLQTLYDRYLEAGRDAEARATIDRMRAIDPSVTPRGTGAGRQVVRGQELVFLDLDGPLGGPAPSDETTGRGPTPEPIGIIERAGGDDDAAPLPVEGLASHEFERIETDATPSLEGLTRQESFTPFEAQGYVTAVPGLEQTTLDDLVASGDPGLAGGAMLDLEPTALGGAGAAAETPAPVDLEPEVLDAVTEAGLDIDLTALEAASSPAASAPEAEQPPSGGPDLELYYPTGSQEAVPEPPATPGPLPSLEGDLGELGDEFSLESWRGPREGEVSRRSEREAPVEGLPLMDLELPARQAPTPAAPRPALDDAAFLDLGVQDPRTPTGDFLAVPALTPSTAKPHTLAVERSLDDLRAAVERAPTSGEARRALGEALLEAGRRDEGLEELERAMMAFERANDLDAATSVADELVRANPETVRLHQKRVEYAFRTNDKPRLVEAYLPLASVLLQGGQEEKARAIYQRVLDLAPDEPRAHAALASLVDVRVERGTTPARPGAGKPLRDGLGAARGPAAPASDFVNLGDMLRDEPAARSTRMVVGEHEPTGDEEADFADMLRKFKQGIAENVGDEDFQSHYDLGIAFKEMGLVDEAIAEFQKALRSPVNRVPTYEALGQCFVEKEQYQLAATVLGRALTEPGASDDALIGVLYLLGRAHEALGRTVEALGYYQRVFVLDITFRDVARRISDVEQANR